MYKTYVLPVRTASESYGTGCLQVPPYFKPLMLYVHICFLVKPNYIT